MLRLDLANGCHLRPLEGSDADELYALIDEHRTYLARWMPWPAGQTIEATREFIRITRQQLTDGTGAQLAIVCEGKIVGVAGFVSVSRAHGSTSIGYWIAEPQQGRGIVTAAVGALTDHALNEWRLNRVEIRAAPENRRSRAIPERLGFREEGVLREAERIGDRYLDSVVYSMLASEWRGAA